MLLHTQKIFSFCETSSPDSLPGTLPLDPTAGLSLPNLFTSRLPNFKS